MQKHLLHYFITTYNFILSRSISLASQNVTTMINGARTVSDSENSRSEYKSQYISPSFSLDNCLTQIKTGKPVYTRKKRITQLKNNIADTIDCQNIFFIMAYKSNLSNLDKHTTLSVCPFSLVGRNHRSDQIYNIKRKYNGKQVSEIKK